MTGINFIKTKIKNDTTNMNSGLGL